MPTSNTLTNFIPEIWSKELIRIYDKTTVMKGLVNTNFQGVISNFGDVVHMRAFGADAVTVKAYTRNSTTISTDTLTSSVLDLTIDQAKYFAFEVDDLDIAQADIGIIEGYTQRAAVTLNNTIDSALLAHYVDVPADNTIGSDAAPKNIASGGEDIYSLLVDLGVRLDEANIPGDGRWIVIPPRVAGVIRKNSLFVQAHQSGDGGAMRRNGMIGTVAGFDIFISSNLSAVNHDASSETPSIYNCLAGTRDFLTFASQVAKMEAVRPYNSFSTIVKGLFLYGKKAVQPTAGALLKINAATI